MISEEEFDLAISRYDDLNSARVIWQSYELELGRSEELLIQGLNLLECCTDVCSLDVGLHHLLESHKDSRISGIRLSPVPLESEIEDWAVIDPRKHIDHTESGHGSYPYPRL